MPNTAPRRGQSDVRLYLLFSILSYLTTLIAQETTIPRAIVLTEDEKGDVGRQVLPDVKVHLL